MGKLIIWSILTISLWAETNTLKKSCLSCHNREQIPSHLIYRRYLMKYSSDKRIEEAMFSYLKNPKKSNSIMPPQFFLKFSMKPALDIDDTILRQQIKAYIQTFDIKKRLRINQ